MMDLAQLFKQTALVLFLAVAAFTVTRGKYFLALIPTVAAVAYFGMLTDDANRETYRYADWAVTTPLMLIAILSANRLPWGLIAAAVGADLLMIFYGYKATQERDVEKKQVNFWISVAAFVPILYLLSKCKYTKNAKYLTLLVWFLYPIVWYFTERRALTDSVSVCVYAVMDVCAKVGLVYFLQA